MTSITRRNAITLAGAGAALAVTSSRAGAQAPAELVWSIQLGLSGASAYAAKFQLAGFTDYVDWKNASGGIRGRRIKLLSEDTTFKVDVAVAGFKKLMANHPEAIFVSGDSTGFVQGTTPENNDRFHKLMTSGSFASEFADKAKFPYVFLAGPSYADMIGVLLEYIKNDWKGSGAPKLAIMHSSIEFGRDPIEFATAKAKAMGMNLVLVAQTKIVEVDVSADALRLRQANPDYAIFHGYAYSTWPEVLKLARDYGMKTKFMGTTWASDAPAIGKLGPEVDGYIAMAPYNYITTNAKEPMLATIDAIRRKQDPSYDGFPTHGYIQSWFNAMIATMATEKVIDAGKELTGENMAAALEGVKDWDTGGIIGIPVTIKNHKMAVGRVWRFNVAKTVTVTPLSDWIRLDG
jgi:branched-chain amino acid transport system substrate-binding protein